MKDAQKPQPRKIYSSGSHYEKKQEVNLNKNSSLYFQIGLIICLLVAFAIFQIKYETTTYSYDTVSLDPEEPCYYLNNYVVEPKTSTKERVAKVPVKQEKKILVTNKVKRLDSLLPIEIHNLVTKPSPLSASWDDKSIAVPIEPANPLIEIFNFIDVEIVPIYPGCEQMKTNKDRVKCMNDRIEKLLQRKFNTDLASQLGLFGKHRIDVQFKINQEGLITELKTMAVHPVLEKEAERVTKQIPKMKPGLQRKKPVSVVYNLPIVFQINQ